LQRPLLRAFVFGCVWAGMIDIRAGNLKKFSEKMPAD
jgi:hypothetical protein